MLNDDHLSAPRQPEHTMESDSADDSLEQLLRYKRELCDTFSGMRRWGNNCGLTLTDIAYAEECCEQTFDDLAFDAWHKLKGISGSIQWPHQIPSFATLRRERMLEGKPRRPVSTNPATNSREGIA